MFSAKHYVPILKFKEGEHAALGLLRPPAMDGITPLFELPPISAHNRVSLDKHLASFGKKLARNWKPRRPLFIDGHLIANEGLMADNRHPLVFAFDDARDSDVTAIPVTGLRRDAAYQGAVRQIVQADDLGVCIRLESEDLGASDVRNRLDNLLQYLGVSRADADIILDLQVIPTGQAASFVAAARGFVNGLPYVTEWRTLTVSATAFPPNLSSIRPNSVELKVREEWLMWQRLASGQGLVRVPSFGDYGIAHPEIQDIDPRFIKVSAGIRYTTDDHW